jgi:uncharacterized membrane protein
VVATSVYLLVFRILHIAAGVAWAGSVFLFVVLVQPSAGAVGPAAGPFMMELLGRRKLVAWLISLGGTTVAAGLFLYWRAWHDYGGLGDFVSSGFGLSLTVGAAAAVAALAVGVLGTRPNVARALELMAAAAGGLPPEQQQELGRIQARLKRLARTSFGLLVLAVLGMATARAW